MSPIPHVPVIRPGLHVVVADGAGEVLLDKWLDPGEYQLVTADPAEGYVNHVYANGTRTLTVKGATS